ncbi:MAG: hypothetical protein EOM61_02960 [Bacteroidia bacterium]|nr:hypothetical protein [Bacteroidia bacterium]
MKAKALFILLFLTTLHFSATGNPGKNDIHPKHDAASLVMHALSARAHNYPSTNNTMNAFYKERVEKNNTCITVNEAILDVNKASYLNSRRDVVAIRDIRGNCTPGKNDDLLVKLQGGPLSALELDVVKYPFLGSFSHKIDESYEFEYAKSEKHGNKEFYVVSFTQKPSDNRTLYRGNIFIEKNSLAIGKIEYSMNVENREWSYDNFFVKRPKGSKVQMISADYVVNYREYDGKWYYDYSTSDIKFNLMNPKDNSYDIYNVSTQMAVTTLIADNFTIDKKDMLNSKDVLTDKVLDHKIASEWDIYNLIMLMAANF